MRVTGETMSTERLQALLTQPDEELNLAEAALCVAQDEYPGLDVSAYLKRLDQLADRLRHKLPAEAGFETRVVALNEFLFDELGFSGNTDDYYDPRNSFLNEVIDRRVGIPITLSILYMEIGSRVGLELEGVSFPGHFLVKSATDEGDVVLDPFAGGVPVAEEDLVQRLEARFGEAQARLAPLPQLLVAANKKDILVRMLRNLKAIYLHREAWDKALTTMNRILLIAPNLPEEVRDRAELYERLECFRPALDGFRHYMELNPASPEALDVRRKIIDLERLASRLN